MRTVWMGMGLLAVVALALYTSVVDPLEATPPEPTEAAPSSARSGWARARTLRTGALPEVAPAVADGVVLFLPALNRSDYRIHPALLDGLPRTLAAFGAAFLDVRPVAPWAARAIATEVGFPGPFAPGSDLEITDAMARALARRVGAASIVWVELGADLSLQLRARDFGAPRVGGWEGLRVALPGAGSEPGSDLDRVLYRAPETLLRALLASGRVSGTAWQPVAAPAGGADALAAARGMIGSGALDEFQRAERALADLIVRHPRWAAPWAELAALRVVRAATLGGPTFVAAALRDGPLAARHVARVLAGSDPGLSARLDVLDHALLAFSAEEGELPAVLAALAPDDPLRALLAYLDVHRPRALFGLDAVEPATPLEALLVSLGSVGGTDARHRAAVARSEEIGIEAVVASPPMLHALEVRAEAMGEWHEEAALEAAVAPASARGAMEAARGICLALRSGSPAAADCWEGLGRALAVYLEVPAGVDPAPGAGNPGAAAGPGAPAASPAPADPGSLADEAVWRPRVEAMAARVLDARIAEAHHEDLPDGEGLDGLWFRPLWLLAATLADAASTALEAREQGSLVAAVPQLVVADRRVQVSLAIERVLDAAYAGSKIARRRAQADDAAPYQRALAPFNHYPTVSTLHARTEDIPGRRELSAALYDRLMRTDPYDERWLWRWNDYAEFRDRIGWGEANYAADAGRIAALVPRSRAHLLLLAKMKKRLEGVDVAAGLVERALARRVDDELVRLQVELLGDRFMSERKRIALLEAALERFPFRIDLREKVASLNRYIGNLEVARQQAQGLLEHPSQFRSACITLARTATSAGDVAGGLETLTSCAQTAESKWDAASLHGSAASMANALGDFERGLRHYQAARARIGGGGYVLLGLGHTYEWMGRYEEAQRTLERHIELYPRAPSAYRALAELHLRRGETQAARSALLQNRGDRRAFDHEDYRILGNIFLREGDLAGFGETCRQEARWPALAELASAHARVSGPAAGLAIIEEQLATQPDHWAARLRKANYLLDLDRTEEALSLYRSLLQTGANLVLRRQLVIAHARAGEPARSRELVDEYRSYYPLHRGGYELEAVLAREEGRRDAALDWIARARSLSPSGADCCFTHEGRLAFALDLEIELGLHERDAAERDRMLGSAEHVALKLHADPEAWERVATLRAASGDRAGAEEALQVVATLLPERGPTRLAAAEPD